MKLLGLALCLVVVVNGAGCLAANPAYGLRPSGEPLSVVGSGQNIGFRQGSRPIDEQDFYSIAGDGGAADTIRNRRRSLVVEQMAWQAVGLAGIGGIVVGAGVMAGGIVWTTVAGPIGLVALLPGVGLMMGSIVAVHLAYVYADDAASFMSRPMLPKSRATAAANRYNKRLGTTSSGERPRRRQRRLRQQQRQSRQSRQLAQQRRRRA